MLLGLGVGLAPARALATNCAEADPRPSISFGLDAIANLATGEPVCVREAVASLEELRVLADATVLTCRRAEEGDCGAANCDREQLERRRDLQQISERAEELYAEATRCAPLRTPPTVTAPTATAPLVASEAAGGWSAQQRWALVTAGSGALSLAVGVYGTSMRSGATDAYNADARCPGVNWSSQPGHCQTYLDDGSTGLALAISGFVLAGAFSITTAYLLLSSPSSPEPTRSTAWRCGVSAPYLGGYCGVSF